MLAHGGFVVCALLCRHAQELNMEVADLLAHPTFMGVSLMQVRVQQRNRPVPCAQVTAFVTRVMSSACVVV